MSSGALKLPPVVEGTVGEVGAINISRLENLTDGVFGFAMTLLVLGLGVDQAFALLESGDVRSGLSTMVPRFLTVAFGMFGLSAFWVAHNAQFRHVKLPDRNLAALNTLALLFIVLLPFSIALWGRRWEDPRVILFIVGNLACINGALWLQFAYIARRRARDGDALPAQTLRSATRGYLLPNAMWLAVALLAFVAPVASVVVFVLTTLSYSIPRLSRWVYSPSRR